MRRRSRVKVDLDGMLQPKGLTRYWLSQETGIKESTLSDIQNGRTKGIKFETIELICDAVDEDPGMFIKRIINHHR